MMEEHDPFEQERRIQEAIEAAEEAKKINLQVLEEIKRLAAHMEGFERDVTEVKALLAEIEEGMEKEFEEAKRVVEDKSQYLDGELEKVGNALVQVADDNGDAILAKLQQLDAKIDAMQSETNQQIKKSMGLVQGEISMQRNW